MNTLADLDELVLRCRSAAAKAYIEEAVSCYRSGAQRSAIVATWVAVVYDFLDKLKELEMSGDANAKEKLTSFENARQSKNWKASLEFERSVIGLAQNDFELLSPVEAVDLERLLEDRNRCAHPSMSSPDDPYQPTAELARNHIRNAVTHLLSQRPVQGKAALDGLLRDVESEYFPASVVKAAEFLNTGPLGSARRALVRNFIIALSKKLLRDASKTVPRERRFSALNAALGMYVAQGEEVLENILPGLVATVPDETWYRALFFLAHIAQSWRLIGNAAQLKAYEYVANAAQENLFKILPYAVQVPALREVAIQRLPEASTETFARMLESEKPTEFVNEALTRFENARSYRRSEKVLEFLVLPLAPVLQVPDVERICKAFLANRQITYAVGVPDLLARLVVETKALGPPVKSAWKPVWEKLEDESDSITTGANLRKELRDGYGFEIELF